MSLNKCFTKILRTKAEPGKGGFWVLNPKYECGATRYLSNTPTKLPSIKTKASLRRLIPRTSSSGEEREDTLENPAAPDTLFSNLSDRLNSIAGIQASYNINPDIAKLLPKKPIKSSISNCSSEVQKPRHSKTKIEGSTTYNDIDDALCDNKAIDEKVNRESLKTKVTQFEY